MSEATNPEETNPTAPEPETPGSETSEPETPEPEAKPAKPAAKAAKADTAEGDAKPAAKAAKKEKPPALEDKPFTDFMTQDFVPALSQTLGKMGIQDLDLKFEKRKLPIAALGDSDCWQLVGHWQGGKRQFIILFSKEDIQGPKFFCYADDGAIPSTIESFMIDERKVNLDLMLMYTVQRLNGQKWLVRN